MDIRWQGHSTFEVVAGPSIVLFDPFPGVPKANEAGEAPLVVTASHGENADIDTSQWRGTSTILEGPGEYEISDIAFRGVPTPRNDENSPRSTNTIFLMEAEGLSVCHLGQLRDTLSSQVQQALGKVDILITPAGGANTIGPEEAAGTIRQLEPKIVLPFYAGDQSGDAANQAVVRLVSEIGVAAGDPLPRLSVARSNLPAELRIVTLRQADS